MVSFSTPLKNKIVKGAAIATTTLFLTLMPMLNGCSKEQKPIEIKTTQTVQLDKRPTITSVKIGDSNNIIAKTTAGDFVFNTDHSLEGAKISKVDYDLWCIMGIENSNEIIVISPILRFGGWELSADTKLLAPFSEGEKLLQNTFQVLSNNTAVILSDANICYYLNCKLISPTSRNPRQPFVNPYAPKERNLFFGKFGSKIIRQNEKTPLGEEVSSKIVYDAQYGEIVEFSHPDWEFNYGVMVVASENAMGDRLNTFTMRK